MVKITDKVVEAYDKFTDVLEKYGKVREKTSERSFFLGGGLLERQRQSPPTARPNPRLPRSSPRVRARPCLSTPVGLTLISLLPLLILLFFGCSFPLSTLCPAQPAFHYGLIPLIIVVGMSIKQDGRRPTLAQLLSPM